MRTLISGSVRPRSGDLVLASVARLGYQTRIELANGRKASLHTGDELVVAYADRYAPDQFEAHVPTHLGVTELVATGGVAASVVSRHRGVRLATRIEPIGLIGDERGSPLNVADFALPAVVPARNRPPVLAVLGTSMNSGKTTTLRYLVNGLSRAGVRVGATKVTGTGSGGDFWVMFDAGAQMMLDFTDVGFASTSRMPMFHLERGFMELRDHLTAGGCEAILIEVADGIYQPETAALMVSQIFKQSVDAVIFAAGEAMGAAHGVDQLRRAGLPVIGVSGRLTMSPLASREAAAASGLPVYDVEQLADPMVATRLLGLAAPTPKARPEGTLIEMPVLQPVAAGRPQRIAVGEDAS